MKVSAWFVFRRLADGVQIEVDSVLLNRNAPHIDK